MKEFWWKLPVLRGLSPLRRGFVEAVAFISLSSALCTWVLHEFISEASAGLCGSLAQIGATLLVAYAVHTAWVLQNSRKRSAQRENWVGITSGIGSCALTGIGIALLLSDPHGSLDWIEAFGLGWAFISVAFLGIWIALQPWAMYDLVHWFNTEYPDE
jgi:hypothetical protein